jgi:hypothetical protein
MKRSGEHQSRGALVDWTTQRWVQATGQGVAVEECSWLEGPVPQSPDLGCDDSPAARSNTAKSYLIPLSQARAFRTPLSDIPEMSFVREGGPDREPGDPVAGLFDSAFDLFLLGLASFE